jgi:tRNA A37 threonylcarbamoyladenosine dehydratase
VHTLVNTIGEAKVDAMKIRLLQINPDCRVTINEDFVSQENAKEYISTEFNYVIEATDNVSAKAAIIAHCKRSKIPMITIGGAGGQLDPTQIKVADLSRTIQDPLAAKLRSYLRRHYNFSDNPKRRFGVQCVYSTEQLRYPQSDGTVSFSKNSQATGTKLDCQTGFGASVNVTASFGLIAAANVLNKLAF